MAEQVKHTPTDADWADFGHWVAARERVEGYVYARQQAADFVRSAGHPELAASILLNWAPGFLPPECPSCNGSGEREVFVFTGGPYPEDGGNGYEQTVNCPDCKGEGLDYGAKATGSAS